MKTALIVEKEVENPFDFAGEDLYEWTPPEVTYGIPKVKHLPQFTPDFEEFNNLVSNEVYRDYDEFEEYENIIYGGQKYEYL